MTTSSTYHVTKDAVIVSNEFNNRTNANLWALRKNDVTLLVLETVYQNNALLRYYEYEVERNY